jgi:transcriptional regulator with XRE-family HTH domain
MKKPRLRVREIAESQGYTASKLAKLTGLSRAIVYPIWRNETAPRLDTLTKIAAALGCKVSDLIEEDDTGQQKAGGTPALTSKVPPAATKAAPIVARNGQLWGSRKGKHYVSLGCTHQGTGRNKRRAE